MDQNFVETGTTGENVEKNDPKTLTSRSVEAGIADEAGTAINKSQNNDGEISSTSQDNQDEFEDQIDSERKSDESKNVTIISEENKISVNDNESLKIIKGSSNTSYTDNVSLKIVKRPSNVSEEVSVRAFKSAEVIQLTPKPIKSSLAASVFHSIASQFNEMPNYELVEVVEDLKNTIRYLGLENTVLLHFLQKNDPSLLEGMENILNTAKVKLDTRSSTVSQKRFTLTRYSRKESSILWNPDAMTIDVPVSVEKEGHRINITQKTDLILREMEDIKQSMQVTERKAYILRHKFKAHLEEMAIRETDIRETLNLFENVFINGTEEKYTQQKNPADKFTRYMEEWFKKSRLTIDKIRLRTSSLKVQYYKTCNQLGQKKIIGENLQEVDFEQLHIENKHLRENIERRNILLLELKKMHGKANLLLSQTKKQLLKKIEKLKEIKDDIKMREDRTAKFDQEYEKVSSELENVRNQYDSIKSKTETYKVPDVLEYVRIKEEMRILKKNLKVWTRRKQLREMSLAGCVREMKHVTGDTTSNTMWFLDPRESQRGRASLESTFEFEFERKKRRQRMARTSKRMTNLSIITQTSKLSSPYFP